MYDDEREAEDERSDGPLNWADVAMAFVLVPYCTAQGFAMAFAHIIAGLGNTSRSIDLRERFNAEAGAAIESMTRGDM